jgi:hypothetical protein
VYGVHGLAGAIGEVGVHGHGGDDLMLRGEVVLGPALAELLVGLLVMLGVTDISSCLNFIKIHERPKSVLNGVSIKDLTGTT